MCVHHVQAQDTSPIACCPRRAHPQATITTHATVGHPHWGRRSWRLRDYVAALHTDELAVTNGTVQGDERCVWGGRHAVREVPGLAGEYQAPPWLSRTVGAEFEAGCTLGALSVAAAGTGQPFRFGPPVLGDEVVYGAKRWFVSQGVPAGGFNHKQTSLSWMYTLRDDVAAAGSGGPRFWECTLRPGEAIYVPG